MNFAGILAGGSGTRMGATELPKQFLALGDKPIIIHTIEQFVICPSIDEIIVAVPTTWLHYAKDIIKRYCPEDNIHIIEGGIDRNSTIMNVCRYIQTNFDDDNNIVVTHDAVRPFVTQRIIKDNIELCKMYDATDTVIPATDTIVESINENQISSIPVRAHMYQGQTPQSFNVNGFIEQYESLTQEEKDILTDASKVYVIKHKNVGLVMGEDFNIKITTKYDLKLANLILKGDSVND